MQAISWVPPIRNVVQLYCSCILNPLSTNKTWLHNKINRVYSLTCAGAIEPTTIWCNLQIVGRTPEFHFIFCHATATFLPRPPHTPLPPPPSRHYRYMTTVRIGADELLEPWTAISISSTRTNQSRYTDVDMTRGGRGINNFVMYSVFFPPTFGIRYFGNNLRSHSVIQYFGIST